MDRHRHSFNPLQRTSLALLFASLATISLLLAQQQAKADDGDPKQSPNDKDDPHRFDVRGMDRTELTRAFAGQLTVLAEAPAAGRNEIVFIDPGVPEREKLLHSIGAKARVIELAPDRDGLSQIASALDRERNVSALHIISHGSEAQIKLVGSADVSLETLPEHLEQLRAIHNAMTPNGDVLLYGCDIAKGVDGKLFFNLLSKLTGENVAASENLTGAGKRGGDWKLEYSAGTVKTQVFAPDATENYEEVLANVAVTNTADSGAGSLRAAIASASSGDTIVFSGIAANSTIILTTTSDNSVGASALAVTNTLTIDGSAAPGLALSGNNARRIFVVPATGNLTLKNITLKNGLAQGGIGGDGRIAGGGAAGLGGAIFNRGTLSLNGCTLTASLAQGGTGGNAAATGFAGGGGGGGLANNGGNAPAGYNGGAGGGPNGGTAGTSGGVNGGNGGYGGGGGGGANGLGYAGGDGGFGGGGGGVGHTGTNERSGNGGFGGGGAGGSGYFHFQNPAFGNGGFAGGNGGYESSTGRNGGGGGAGLGGAVFNNQGTLSVTNSTLIGNSAIGGAGGSNAVAGGTAPAAGSGLGGGIFNRNGSCTILNCTISGNTAAQGGRGIYNLGDGATATLALNNSIVGQSDTAVNDFTGSTINAGTNTTSGIGNIIRTQSGFAGTVVSTADPMLAPLASNGGPTQTMALNAGSPALDAGNNAAASGLNTDQRGLTRVSNGAVDIGAFELQVAPAISSITPISGSAVGGTSVTITGTGFSGATAVKFGATNAASFTVNSATQITATSPAGAVGAVDVTVTTPGGTSATSAADKFTYVAASSPLTITSAPTATPNPAAVQQTVQFTAAATGSGTLTYAWNFGDGATGTGSSVTHAYAAAGAYSATVTVTDGNGGTATASVSVTVNAAAPLDPNGDANGDGYTNDVAQALGANPSAAGSTPLALPVITSSGTLGVKQLHIKLDFSAQNSDGVRISGTIPGVTKLPPESTLILNVGHVIAAYTFDKHGRAIGSSGPKGVLNDTCQLRVTSKGATFTAKLLQGSFQSALSSEANPAFDLTSVQGSSPTRSVNVAAYFGAAVYKATVTGKYKAAQGTFSK